MKAHYHLVRHAVRDMAYTVSVFDGEEFAVRRSTNVRDIMGAIESVDESELLFRTANGERIGWALIVLGNDGGDEVSDHTDNEWMNEWFNRVVMGAA